MTTDETAQMNVRCVHMSFVDFVCPSSITANSLLFARILVLLHVDYS